MKRSAVMMGGASDTRAAVRDLYKRVVRLGNTWEARNPAQTPKERAYILEEARTLFHQHMHETDTGEVQRLMQEAEGRVEIAEHYGIPYQRASNLPPGTSADDYRRGQISFGEAPRYHASSHPLFDD